MLIQLLLIGGGLTTYLHQRNKRNTTVSPNLPFQVLSLPHSKQILNFGEFCKSFFL